MRTLQEASMVRKRGASFYARIPKRIFDYLGWHQDDSIVVTAFPNKLVIQHIAMDKFAISAAAGEEAGE